VNSIRFGSAAYYVRLISLGFGFIVVRLCVREWGGLVSHQKG
jgi:hypothetical protein